MGVPGRPVAGSETVERAVESVGLCATWKLYRLPRTNY